MIKCLHTKIDILLGSCDAALQRLFSMEPSTVRKILEEKKAAGEVYIPSTGCEGFDPVKGCPGHENEPA